MLRRVVAKAGPAAQATAAGRGAVERSATLRALAHARRLRRAWLLRPPRPNRSEPISPASATRAIRPDSTVRRSRSRAVNALAPDAGARAGRLRRAQGRARAASTSRRRSTCAVAAARRPDRLSRRRLHHRLARRAWLGRRRVAAGRDVAVAFGAMFGGILVAAFGARRGSADLSARDMDSALPTTARLCRDRRRDVSTRRRGRD